MHIAHSALATPPQIDNNKTGNNAIQIRYQAYLSVCDKYKHEIKAIQKYLPNWVPAFNY
jgi:hypothetical protein